MLIFLAFVIISPLFSMGNRIYCSSVDHRLSFPVGTLDTLNQNEKNIQQISNKWLHYFEKNRLSKAELPLREFVLAECNKELISLNNSDKEEITNALNDFQKEIDLIDAGTCEGNFSRMKLFPNFSMTPTRARLILRGLAIQVGLLVFNYCQLEMQQYLRKLAATKSLAEVPEFPTL